MAWLKVADALNAPIGTELTVKGWVRTRRDSKADGGLSFLAIHDGTCQDPIQMVVRRGLPSMYSLTRLLTLKGLATGDSEPERVASATSCTAQM